MPGVICPIRGGPSSQPTIKRAIALAKEKNLDLHFLLVVNLDFLTYTGSFRQFTLAFLLLFIILGLILPGESIQAQELDPAVLFLEA